MKTLIIGGGLSGLTLAEMLERQGGAYHLVEARGRFGGRIKAASSDGGQFDLGPAWFWPGQPRMADLMARLGIDRFDQYSAGVQVFEDERGRVQHGRGFASMEGSWRVKGGLAALTDALAARLPESRRELNAQVTALTRAGDGITARLQGGATLRADRVVLALPPRVAAEITFAPALPVSVLDAMQNVPTWMAGQAKAVAVYDAPFWRDAGLSGDATSRAGPMVELHDASAEGGPFALFGFIGVPPQGRQDEAQLRAAVLAQLQRLFGPQAATPREIFIKDWAVDPLTATLADHAPLSAHPAYGMPRELVGLWDHQLQFAGTEVGAAFGGYLEGALEAAEHALEMLTAP